MKKENIELVKEDALSKKQSGIVVKVGKIFIYSWCLLIVFPVMIFCLINAVSIKEFIVVKSVYEANKMLMSEYEDISMQLISKVNLSQYISKIKIPEIDLEKFVKTTGKVGKTSYETSPSCVIL